ncbi:MAG: DUF4215 domain-containing protein [Myxococcota bacterium]
MPRLLKTTLSLISVSAAATMGAAACGDDTTTSEATTSASSTSTTTGGLGGTGGIAVTTSTGGTGGGTGGTGGTGGMPPMVCEGPDTGTDLCDGETIVLALGDELSLCGTVDTNDDYQGFSCGPDSGSGEKVYNITVQAEGSLRVQVRRDEGSELIPSMFLREQGACEDASSAADGSCFAFFSTHEEFADDWDPAFIPGFHLFIDGQLDENGIPTTGDYQLDISLQPAACGDGVWNRFTTTEECDDGNTNDGDGCSSACIVETTNLFDDCPGDPFVWTGQQVVRSGSTVGNQNDYMPSPVGTCSNVTMSGRERVYQFAASQSGMATVSVGFGTDCSSNVCDVEGNFSPGCWDYVLWATGPDTSSCGNAASQLACSDANAVGPESISFPVTAGIDYNVYVDGFDDDQFGPFNLCVDVTP